MSQPLSNAAKPAFAPGTKPPAVDTHFHVFSAGVAVPGARYVPGYDAPLSRWQALAHAAGVQRGVLVQTSFLGADNSLLLHTLAQYPRHLRGVAVVTPQTSAAELHAMHRAGVRGIRLNLAGRSTDLSLWQAPALWDALLSLGWHVELHTDRGALPAALAQVPSALPVVVDHMGKPERASVQDASVRAVRQRQGAPAWVKLSGPYRLGGCDAQVLAQIWLHELGPGQLLWGSDWPFTNHERDTCYDMLHQQLGDWLPDPGLHRAVLHHNPQHLYWPEETAGKD